MLAKLAVALLFLLPGCGAREPSSTDNHNRTPKADCTLVEIGGSHNREMRRMCCEGERCWISD